MTPCTVLFPFEQMETAFSWLRRFYPSLKSVNTNSAPVPNGGDSHSDGLGEPVDAQVRVLLKQFDEDDYALWHASRHNPEQPRAGCSSQNELMNLSRVGWYAGSM